MQSIAVVVKSMCGIIVISSGSEWMAAVPLAHDNQLSLSGDYKALQPQLLATADHDSFSQHDKRRPYLYPPPLPFRYSFETRSSFSLCPDLSLATFYRLKATV